MMVMAFQSSPIFRLPRARLECSELIFRFMRSVGVCVLLIIMDGPGEKRLASVKRHEGDPPEGAPSQLASPIAAILTNSAMRLDDQRPRTGPELRIATAAAQTGTVSEARIRPDSWKSVRLFKGIICDDISKFESYMPSHAVRSLQWRSSTCDTLTRLCVRHAL